MRLSVLAMTFWMFLLLPVAAQKPAPSTPVAGGKDRMSWYLPHLTWEDVEAYLRTSDMILIPAGSIEQHGKHLPLGSDCIQAEDMCFRLAERCRLLVAPTLPAGISDHHLGFPGTIALSAATFQAVLFETAQSLIAHGFRRLLFYTGHGGNAIALASVIDRINRETPAFAIDLTKLVPPADDPALKNVPFDYHAGVEETSVMLHIAPLHVRKEKLENPVLTLPPGLAAIYALEPGGIRDALDWAASFVPMETGKHTSTRELSNNGVFTYGRLEAATSALGRARIDSVVTTLAKAIDTWRRISAGATQPPVTPGK